MAKEPWWKTATSHDVTDDAPVAEEQPAPKKAAKKAPKKAAEEAGLNDIQDV